MPPTFSDATSAAGEISQQVETYPRTIRGTGGMISLRCQCGAPSNPGSGICLACGDMLRPVTVCDAALRANGISVRSASSGTDTGPPTRSPSESHSGSGRVTGAWPPTAVFLKSIECENCQEWFDADVTGWLCPACRWKNSCCG